MTSGVCYNSTLTHLHVSLYIYATYVSSWLFIWVGQVLEQDIGILAALLASCKRSSDFF